MKNLPNEFIVNMKELLKDDFEKFLAIYDNPYTKAIRVNTKKTTTEELQKLITSLTDKIPFTQGFYINADDKLGNNPYHHAGLFYVQEPSAMQPALCTEIAEDAVVLDLCASPGGKSGQLAEQLSNKGLLVSNEIITARAKILKENMDRLGYSNVIVTSTTPQNLTRLGKMFDVILVDAPCSGEGLFRKEPNAVNEWNSGINKMNSERQLELLELVTKLLKPNGKIIYSTCTFSKLENEEVVKKFLNKFVNFKLDKINDNLTPYSTYIENENLRRVLPHTNKGEGQFYACLKSTENAIIDNKNYTYLENLKASEKNIVNEFIAKYTNLKNLNIKSYEGNILLPPEKEINTKGIFVLKYGINLGKIEKRRFIPNHNFFTSLGNSFKICINLENETQITNYLKGEQIEVNDITSNGYCTVCVNGYALGGGKIQNGKINNLYPKYLRLK